MPWDSLQIVVSLFLFFVVIALFLLYCLFEVVTIQGQSMLPTLADGDRILVRRLSSARRLRYGTIILIKQLGENTTTPTQLVKRVVGLPGETLITVLDDLPKGLQSFYYDLHDKCGKRTWYIPSGYVFVRGDNRKESMDSLAWGPISFLMVKGIMLRKLTSISA